MRTIIIVAVLLIAVTGILICCREKKKAANNPAPMGRLIGFTYSVSGSTVEPIHDFTLELIDTTSARLRINGMSDPVRDSAIVGRDVLDRVAQIIIEHKMQNYKSSYEPKFEVLDGEMWSYNATYADGTSLYSGGYHAWPEDNGLSEICAYLDSCLIKAKNSKP